MTYKSGAVSDDKRVDIERFYEGVTVSKLQTDDPDATRALTTIRRGVQRLARQHDKRVLNREEIADQIDEGSEDPSFHPVVAIEPLDNSLGEGMIPAVAYATALLDGEGYRSNLCAGRQQRDLDRPAPAGTHLSNSVPIDAVKALMDGGPIRRSAVLYDGSALVMSLGAERFDRVVAEAPRLVFVEQQADKRTFDLYERYVPRFREPLTVVLLKAETQKT